MSGITGRLDDTDNCPLDGVCRECGRPGPSLRVVTVDVDLGVGCWTMCQRCVDAEAPPAPMSYVEAARLVMGHCGHLGVDLEQMADLMKAERGE